MKDAIKFYLSNANNVTLEEQLGDHIVVFDDQNYISFIEGSFANTDFYDSQGNRIGFQVEVESTDFNVQGTTGDDSFENAGGNQDFRR